MAKMPADIRSLCRAYTDETVRIVAGIVRAQETPAATRIAGIAMLWERGWGKAPTTHTGPDGEGDIRVTIRHIIEGRGAPVEHAVKVERPALPAPNGAAPNGADDE